MQTLKLPFLTAQCKGERPDLKYLIQFDLMISSINCIESGAIEVNQKVVDIGK